MYSWIGIYFFLNRNEYNKSNYLIFGRMIEYPAIYYGFAIIIDLVLRFSWSFTLVSTTINPYFSNNISEVWFVSYIEIAELVRRAIWSTIRVENAHLSRKDEFRSYDYVPLLYEQMTLVENYSPPRSKSIIMEIMCLTMLVVIITIVIWGTY